MDRNRGEGGDSPAMNVLRFDARKIALAYCRKLGCTAMDKPAGCGYIEAGTRCRESRHRDEWERKRKEKRGKVDGS